MTGWAGRRPRDHPGSTPNRAMSSRGQIDPAVAGVLADVAEDVRELQRDPARARPAARPSHPPSDSPRCAGNRARRPRRRDSNNLPGRRSRNGRGSTSIETPSIASSSKSGGDRMPRDRVGQRGKPGPGVAAPVKRRSSSRRQAVERCATSPRPTPARRPGRRCAAGRRRGHTSTAVDARQEQKRVVEVPRLATRECAAEGVAVLEIADPSSSGSSPMRRRPDADWRSRAALCRRSERQAASAGPRAAPTSSATMARPKQPRLGPCAQGRPAAQHVEPPGLDPVEDRQAAAREQVDVDRQRPGYPRDQRRPCDQREPAPARPRIA